MRTYRGRRDDGEAIVTVDDGSGPRELSPKKSQKVMNHSPDGFEWAYQGSGPAQLALALLLDAFSERGTDWATKLHQDFKRKVVSNLPHEGWTLTSEQIRAAVQQLEAQREANG